MIVTVWLVTMGGQSVMTRNQLQQQHAGLHRYWTWPHDDNHPSSHPDGPAEHCRGQIMQLETPKTLNRWFNRGRRRRGRLIPCVVRRLIHNFGAGTSLGRDNCRWLSRVDHNTDNNHCWTGLMAVAGMSTTWICNDCHSDLPQPAKPANPLQPLIPCKSYACSSQMRQPNRNLISLRSLIPTNIDNNNRHRRELLSRADMNLVPAANMTNQLIPRPYRRPHGQITSLKELLLTGGCQVIALEASAAITKNHGWFEGSRSIRRIESDSDTDSDSTREAVTDDETVDNTDTESEEDIEITMNVHRPEYEQVEVPAVLVETPLLSMDPGAMETEPVFMPDLKPTLHPQPRELEVVLDPNEPSRTLLSPAIVRGLHFPQSVMAKTVKGVIPAVYWWKEVEIQTAPWCESVRHVEVLRKLSGPCLNIIRLLGYYRLEADVGLIMEQHITTWSSCIYNGCRLALPDRLVVHMAASMCLALTHVHQHSLVHMHLSPAAMAVTLGGRVCLTELAEAMDTDAACPEACGVLHYRCPDLLKSDCVADAYMDWWSLAIVIMETYLINNPTEGYIQAASSELEGTEAFLKDVMHHGKLGGWRHMMSQEAEAFVYSLLGMQKGCSFKPEESSYLQDVAWDELRRGHVPYDIISYLNSRVGDPRVSSKHPRRYDAIYEFYNSLQ